jgi:hypothetical protein
MSVFGFSTEPSSGGDWLPIVKYDARAGRFFRVDYNGTDNEPIDITGNFKALVDFENVEVGWIDFPVGSIPSFVLVPMGSKLPDRPSDKHKNGIRFMVKLAKDCAGDRPIREIASTARVFLAGIEAAYLQYLADKDKNPGKLPVLMLEKTTPVTAGSGQKTSTNYQPTFRIAGWAPRGDLQPQPKGMNTPAQAPAQSYPSNGSGNAAPATGAQRAVPPPQQAVSADDFG